MHAFELRKGVPVLDFLDNTFKRLVRLYFNRFVMSVKSAYFFLLISWCGKFVVVRYSVETVRFHKISLPENSVKLRYFMQLNKSKEILFPQLTELRRTIVPYRQPFLAFSTPLIKFPTIYDKLLSKSWVS